MFLGFDIGNTKTTMGIYGDNSSVPEVIRNFDTRRNVLPDNLGKKVKKFLDEPACDVDWKDIVSDVTGIAFSSVVPEVNAAYHEMALSHFGIDSFEIDHKSKLSISITYPDPSQLGPDRIVNAEAAYAEYGEELIIIDLGTAATFCVLEKNGVFDGGIIAPGIGTTIRALAKKASRLPKIQFEKPDRLVARDTENAVKSGFFYGWMSLIEGLIDRIEKEYGKKFRVILTGGFGKVVAEYMNRKCIVDGMLTMKGIKYIFERNRV